MLRFLGRCAGALFRLPVWLLCAPLGWLLSRNARQRRRHNQLVRAIRQPRPHVVPPPAIAQPWPRGYHHPRHPGESPRPLP